MVATRSSSRNNAVAQRRRQRSRIHPNIFHFNVHNPVTIQKSRSLAILRRACAIPTLGSLPNLRFGNKCRFLEFWGSSIPFLVRTSIHTLCTRFARRRIHTFGAPVELNASTTGTLSIAFLAEFSTPYTGEFRLMAFHTGIAAGGVGFVSMDVIMVMFFGRIQRLWFATSTGLWCRGFFARVGRVARCRRRWGVR